MAEVDRTLALVGNDLKRNLDRTAFLETNRWFERGFVDKKFEVAK
jgi:hypothetical protein